jgi:hypothetical protein
MRAWTPAPHLPSPASSPAPRRTPTCSRCSSLEAALAGTLPRARTSTSASSSLRTTWVVAGERGGSSSSDRGPPAPDHPGAGRGGRRGPDAGRGAVPALRGRGPRALRRVAGALEQTLRAPIHRVEAAGEPHRSTSALSGFIVHNRRGWRPTRTATVSGRSAGCSGSCGRSSSDRTCSSARPAARTCRRTRRAPGPDLHRRGS